MKLLKWFRTKEGTGVWAKEKIRIEIEIDKWDFENKSSHFYERSFKDAVKSELVELILSKIEREVSLHINERMNELKAMVSERLKINLVDELLQHRNVSKDLDVFYGEQIKKFLTYNEKSND